MAAPPTPAAPRLSPATLSEAPVELTHGGRSSEVLLTGDFAGAEIEDLALDRSRIAASFTGARLPRLNLTDVALEGEV